ncbi:complement decay-accelerating factor-like [Mytilus edulis]|uniref:complement decay-accelerating factor-like n=1 Tax=Mytilus edulis TaxID=6550 RepID=UPI0039EF0077
MTWEDAKASCKANGMELVTYKSYTDLSNIYSSEYYWLGTSWKPTLQQFQWVDGTLWSINDAIFPYKRITEPNCLEGLESCSSYQNCIYFEYTKIGSQTCSNTYKSLCQTIKTCTSPPSIMNAATDTTVVKSPGEMITYTCDFGYELSGGQSSWTRECGIDGNWTTDSNVCVVKQCIAPPPVSNSNYNTLAVTNPGETITYTCDTGYYMSKGQTVWTRLCEWGGTWAMDTNSCSGPSE